MQRAKKWQIAVGIMLVGAIALVGGPLLRAAYAPAARWELVSQDGYDLCSARGEYCRRATCVVRNVGDAAGTAEVTAVLSKAGRPDTSKSMTISVAAGAERSVEMRFPEAPLREPSVNVSCQLGM